MRRTSSKITELDFWYDFNIHSIHEIGEWMSNGMCIHFTATFSSAGRGNGCGAGRHWIYDHGSCPHDWHACDTLCRSGIWAACSKISVLRFGLHALTNIRSSRGFNHGVPVGTIYLLVVYHKYGLHHHFKWENSL